MKHFLLPGPGPFPDDLKITGKDHHYLAHVLRKRKGDTFTGVDPEGRFFNCIVTQVGRDSLILDVTEIPSRAEHSGNSVITLYQCIPKGKKMDLIIRQAAETGVTAVVPVLSSHTIPTFSDKDREEKLKRWSRIARGALQQSGAVFCPEVRPITKLENIPLQENSSDIRLVFHHEPIAQKSLHQYLSRNGKVIDIIIGPEGGLSGDEIDFLKHRGFKPAFMGKHVYRTETAALCAIASIQIILLEKTSWALK